MLRLIQNEYKKIFSHYGIYLMLGFLIIFIVGHGIFIKMHSEHGKSYGANWKQELQMQNSKLIKESQEMPENFLAYEYNKKTIALNEYRIQHNIPPENTNSLWTFILSNKPFLSFISLFIIALAATSISSEFNRGTINLIMVRPISRFSFLLSRYMVIVSLCFILIIMLVLLSIGVGYLLFGNSELNTYLVYHNGQVFEEGVVLYISRYFLFASIDIIAISSIAFMISTLFQKNTLSLVMSLCIYFMAGTTMRILAQKYDWTKYIIFSNTDLNMYYTGDILIKGMSLSFSVIIVLLYLFAFLLISFTTFIKRDIIT
ncbi:MULTISPECIES: ABC transporter permease [Bacillus cereus group]|uniref:ABC transporter permease n=1 Tax=Bacillus cereus group TaxID=86661 RepID=UPI000BF2C828|nr:MULTISPECIES: ABC transporter permease [Bacillus cereus group]KAA0804075.1 ABC transporter permease [Bacillus sp. AY2-1]MED2492308.1 ABC transporter permease [Bacillus thuringiensis]PFF58003.1 hypothetical protein CN358_25200 [Bacillus thuringiensis]